ncbi:MAG: OmpA family protein [Chlorobi bacterium]|nr:OmpA family protein [Chlorobiota bacterium]
MKKITLLILMLLNVFFLQAQNNDAKGSKDYDLFGRMPDYNIRNYWDYQFDAHEFFISKDQKQVIEGRKIVIRFEHQNANDRNVKKPSYLQILRNYSNAIKEAGGKILFEHRNADFGYYFLKTTQGKEVWVEVTTAPNTGRRYTLTVIEREPMKQDIVVEADLIKEKIQIEGKIAIYGIYFDVGKSLIKPESTESLEQIALFLKENPDINCWVVGHTDSDGSFEINSKLSLYRAKAVISYLQGNHSISPDRLFAQGVGPLAPVSTNDTEEGRKLNRRVEFVKK